MEYAISVVKGAPQSAYFFSGIYEQKTIRDTKFVVSAGIERMRGIVWMVIATAEAVEKAVVGGGSKTKEPLVKVLLFFDLRVVVP